jgi:hypothetical protein
MRLRPLHLLSLSLAMACGSSTSNSTPSYDIAASGRTETGTLPGQIRINTFTLTVTDDNGQPVASNAIILQLSAGTAVPNNPVTNVAGQASVTWTVPVAEQQAGRLEGLAFCAPVAGNSFCKTNLSGPDKITAQF